jgi:hypothetical protein
MHSTAVFGSDTRIQVQELHCLLPILFFFYSDEEGNSVDDDDDERYGNHLPRPGQYVAAATAGVSGYESVESPVHEAETNSTSGSAPRRHHSSEVSSSAMSPSSMKVCTGPNTKEFRL